MRFLRPLFALTAVAAGLALGAPAAHAQAPDGVVPTSPQLDFLLGLKREQGDLARLARTVSDRSSPHYRRYLDVREISRRFGANPVTKRSVKRFFAKRGVAAKVDPSGAFATVSLTPAQIGSTFGIGARAAASGKVPPPVPAALRGAVTGISVPAAGPEPEPGAELPPGFKLERTGTPRGCAAGLGAKGSPILPTGGFTPNQTAAAHGFAPLHRRGLRGQGRRIALLEYDGGFERSDMDTFAACFGLPKPKLAVRRINGQVPMPGSARNSDEVALDIQVVMGLAPRAAIDVYEGNADASFGMGFAAALAPRKGQGLPDVISLSYGACELFLTDLAAKSQRRVDRYMIDVATAAGVPILAASMDHGSSGCADFPVPELQKRIEASYPSTAQYVTAVGGTSFTLRADNSILSQRVWNDSILGALDRNPGAGGGGIEQARRAPLVPARRGPALQRGRQGPPGPRPRALLRPDPRLGRLLHGRRLRQPRLDGDRRHQRRDPGVRRRASRSPTRRPSATASRASEPSTRCSTSWRARSGRRSATSCSATTTSSTSAAAAPTAASTAPAAGAASTWPGSPWRRGARTSGGARSSSPPCARWCSGSARRR